MARTLTVSELRISVPVAAKLVDEHGLDPADVRRAVVNVGPLPFMWHHHPERGDRALIWTAVGDDDCLVVLYPAVGEAADVWNLGSAYPIDDDA